MGLFDRLLVGHSVRTGGCRAWCPDQVDGSLSGQSEDVSRYKLGQTRPGHHAQHADPISRPDQHLRSSLPGQRASALMTASKAEYVSSTSPLACNRLVVGRRSQTSESRSNAS